ncbi:MAG: winged helix-turn-helix domain-containing protein [Elusimicrobia bacterium]|nr:winged helix-turn-helix domain-containing protein [Candidatus Liberimonas magnetica]
MLEPILGNKVVEKVLFYILNYGDGYARGIARTFEIPFNGVQQQIKRLENGGVIAAQNKGNVRLYKFNPSYPFLKSLKQLLQEALDVLPEKEIEKYYRMRTRPRRKGKPL